MQALFAGLDRADTKNTIRDLFIENAEHLGFLLSRTRADKAANAYKRGRLDEMDPELCCVLQHVDPTAKTAVSNVMRGFIP